MTIPVDHAMPSHQISPRRKLLPGRLFKTVRGSGPVSRGNPIGVFGTFLARRIYTVAGRTYVEAIGERTGRLPESMAHLAEQYRDQARRMMHMLTVAGGFAVAALVGMLILGVIFMMLSRTLFPYYDTVRELSR